MPTTPPPITITLAAATPGTPPSRMPRPPSGFSSMKAPAWVAILPAISLIGASSGRRPRRVLDRLVGDAGGARVAEATGQLRIGRQVQVGEEQLAGAQHLDLDRLRLLDLDHHLGLGEDGGRVGDDAGALGLEVGVGDRAALAGASLDQHLVAVLDHLAHAGRGDRDPVLVGLDLCRYADPHVTSSLARRASQNSIRSWARERSRPVSSSTLRIR